MYTYSTFAECLKNHPKQKVMTTGSEWSGEKECNGKFLPDGGVCVTGERGWVEAKPEDHLMTLEEFLGAGYLTNNGDTLADIDSQGLNVYEVGNDASGAEIHNVPSRYDSDMFILSAACFDGGSHPPESKAVEVNVKLRDVKVDKGASIFDLKEEFECGSLFNPDGMEVTEESYLMELLTTDLLYRRVASDDRHEWIIAAAMAGEFEDIRDGSQEYISLGAIYDAGLANSEQKTR